MEFKERLSPIYMIGDSQCLIFNNLRFEATWQNQDFSFVTQAKYCPGIAANNFFEGGRLHPHVLRALLSECLIDTNNQALYQFKSPLSSIITLLAGRTVSSPIFLFFCGTSDVVNVFLKYLTDQHDFYLPGQEDLLKAFEAPKVAQVYPYATARDFVQKLLDPFFEGLLRLRSMGLDALYVHCLPPFTMDDQEFSNLYMYPCPRYTRYKTLIFFNQMLKENCQKHRIGFVDIWDDVTLDNQLNPDFYLDTIHLNKEAAFLTMNRFWEVMTGSVERNALSSSGSELYDQLVELTVQIFARNQKHALVIEHFKAHEPLLQEALKTPDIHGKVPFLVSCLYYIAGAYYRLQELPHLKAFIQSYHPLFETYKPPMPHIQTETAYGLIFSSGPPKDPLELPLDTYYLIGPQPALEDWQAAFATKQFLIPAQQQIEQLQPLGLGAKTLYVSHEMPTEAQDLVLFLLIEGTEVLGYG